MGGSENRMNQVEDDQVYIVAFGRTPIGSFQGRLSRHSAVQLMSTCVEKVFERSDLMLLKSAVNDLVIGHVCQAGLRQAPANQVARLAGLSSSVNCTLVNKVCSSGMKAIIQAVQSLRLHDSQLVITGGMESMSNAPHLLRIRGGIRYGNGTVEDTLVVDGLSDAETAASMGEVTERLAQKMSITREEQDAFAILSYERAIRATEAGLLAHEIIPIDQVATDEELSKFHKEKMLALKPAFPIQQDGRLCGTITAASSSKLSDGAAALILASGHFCREKGIQPLARIVGYAEATQDSYLFGTSPSIAIQRLLEKCPEYSLGTIDLFEINEAFAAVTLANLRILGVPVERCNVHGGAVALGHPLGASGARIVCTLVNALQMRGKKSGIAAVCHGGGGATALLIELVDPVFQPHTV